MKKSLQKLFTGVSLAVATIGVAQPTLTATGINPVVGDAFPSNVTNYIAPGNAGANQAWNLSTFTITSTNNVTAVNPTSTTYSANFTNANVCDNGSGEYFYYKTSSTALQVYGIIVGSNVVPYSNPEDFLRFPFTFNNSYTDTWAATFVSNGSTFYRRGADSTKADGYGTLTLPNGTYSNVTRIHFVQNYQDSTNLSGFPYVITYRNDEYLWYLNGNHYPIALVASLVNSAASTPSQYGSYLQSITAGIENPSAFISSISLFPNPATNNINLNLSLTENKQVEIQVLNILGSEVGKTTISEGVQGTNDYKLDIANLSEGIYFARISLNGALASTQKFIISK